MELLKNKIKHKKLRDSSLKNNYSSILFPADVLSALELLKACLNRQFLEKKNELVEKIYDDWAAQKEIASFQEYAVVACFPDIIR